MIFPSLELLLILTFACLVNPYNLNEVINFIDSRCDIRVSYFTSLESFVKPSYNPISLFNLDLYKRGWIKLNTTISYLKRQKSVQKWQNIDCRFHLIETRHCEACSDPKILKSIIEYSFFSPVEWDVLAKFNKIPRLVPLNTFTAIIYSENRFNSLRTEGKSFPILFYEESNYFKALSILILPDPPTSKSVILCTFPIGLLKHLEIMSCQRFTPKIGESMKIRILTNIPKAQTLYPEKDINILKMKHSRKINSDGTLDIKLLYTEALLDLSLFVVQFLMQADNITKIGCKHREGPSVLEVTDLEETLDSSFDLELYLVHREHMRGFSCYTEAFVSFHMYLRPFQFELWIAILVTIITLVILTTWYVKSKASVWLPDVVLFMIGSLIEEPPTLRSKIWNLKVVRLLLFPWLVVSIVLTSCYLGIVISDVNSPLKSEGIQNLTDIYCPCDDFSTKNEDGLFILNSSLVRNFWHTMNEVRQMKWLDLISETQNLSLRDLRTNLVKNETLEKTMRAMQDPKCFSLLSAIEDLHPNFVENGLYQIQPSAYMQLMDHAHINSGKSTLNHFLCPAHRHVPKSVFEKRFPKEIDPFIALDVAANIEMEISACGKSTFLGFDDEVIAEKEYMERNYPNCNFYFFTDNADLGSRSRHYMFLGDQGTNLVQSLYTLMESGIYINQRLKMIRVHYLYRAKRTRLLSGDSKHSTISGNLRSSLQTVFYIWLGTLFAGLMPFAVEKRVANRKLSLNTALEEIFMLCQANVGLSLVIGYFRSSSRVMHSIEHQLQRFILN